MDNPGANAHIHFPNRFRQRLLAGDTLIGCWLSLGSPITTEGLGIAGFDWLLLDCEHAPNDVLALIPQLMALKDSPSAPIARPSWNDTVEIKRLLDAGVHNFLIPFVESAEQARAAVAATRYPPQGVRGVSVSQRSNRYGDVKDYFKRVNDQISVLVQIESRAGVAAAAQIAADAHDPCLFAGPRHRPPRHRRGLQPNDGLAPGPAAGRPRSRRAGRSPHRRAGQIRATAVRASPDRALPGRQSAGSLMSPGARVAVLIASDPCARGGLP
nr:aldolase/citrate lyase family protein [Burkholderiaceae bacterium]